MGFTVVNPAEFRIVPRSAESFLSNSKYWTVYMGDRRRRRGVYHNQLQKTDLPYTGYLGCDKSAAIAVDSKGDLHYFYSSSHVSVVCKYLPMEPLWGFVDVYGNAVKVRVEILHSE